MTDSAFPGGELRQRRNELAYTPEEIYRDIHIPVTYLHALEEGRIEDLPAETYVVGFLRSYCIHLGLSPNRYVDAYRNYAQPRSRRAKTAKGAGLSDRPHWLSELRTWAAVCAVLLLLWITYTVVFAPPDKPNAGAVAAGTQELVVPTPPYDNSGAAKP